MADKKSNQSKKTHSVGISADVHEKVKEVQKRLSEQTCSQCGRGDGSVSMGGAAMHLIRLGLEAMDEGGDQISPSSDRDGE